MSVSLYSRRPSSLLVHNALRSLPLRAHRLLAPLARTQPSPAQPAPLFFSPTMAEQKQKPLTARKKHYVILEAGVLPDDLSRRFGSFPDMFLSWLKDDDCNEHWDVIRVCRSVVPTADKLAHYDGIVITGSSSAAYDQDEWVTQLKALMVEVAKRKQKVLGVCFGHQIIGAALGGEVKKVGWLGGTQTIKASDAMQKLYPMVNEPVYGMLETHQDQVVKLPEKALLLGSSEHCAVEAFQYPAQQPTIMCVQYHPEFPVKFMRVLIDQKEKNGVISAEVAERARASLPSDHQEMTPAVRRWLKTWFKHDPTTEGARAKL